MANSVIFVGSPEHNKKSTTYKQNLKQLFIVSPHDIMSRIFRSFIPPVTKKYQMVYVDLLGPLLAIIILTALVTYGNSLREVQLNITPSEFIFVQSVLMPLMCFLISRLGQSTVTFYETISLVGYSFYGHLFTLLVSFIWFQETSDAVFFACLIFFGGLSTLRLALVFLNTIPVPAARLVICTTISVINLLYLIFLHFAFMHRNYVYKGG